MVSKLRIIWKQTVAAKEEERRRKKAAKRNGKSHDGSEEEAAAAAGQVCALCYCVTAVLQVVNLTGGDHRTLVSARTTILLQP